MQDVYRTPDSRFEGLPEFPYAPHYAESLPGYAGLRMHYLDEGPASAAHVYLCLHGEPTWCYLYRKMLEVFVGAGGRVVAPDLFGFGRSDKPADGAYSFDFHRGSLIRLIEHLDLRNVTLVCQDWGGVLGLTLPLDLAPRITGVIAMNTVLCTGELPLPPAFARWKQWAAEHPDMDIAEAMAVIDPDLPAAVRAIYRAPFPDRRSKAGARAFPELVPTTADAPGAEISRRARDWWQNAWRGQALVACGVKDEILGLPVMQLVASWIKDCPPVFEVAEAGHFVQEHGARVAREALAVFGR